MSEREEIGHERVMLLHKCTEMNLSENIVLEISLLIKNSKDRDEKAKEIRLLIEDCETEEEVLEKIRTL